MDMNDPTYWGGTGGHADYWDKRAINPEEPWNARSPLFGFGGGGGGGGGGAGCNIKTI